MFPSQEGQQAVHPPEKSQDIHHGLSEALAEGKRCVRPTPALTASCIHSLLKTKDFLLSHADKVEGPSTKWTQEFFLRIQAGEA